MPNMGVDKITDNAKIYLKKRVNKLISTIYVVVNYYNKASNSLGI